MRRAAALLILIVFGLTRAGAAACPMGASGGESAPPPHHQASHSHPSAPGDAQHAGHGQTGCGVVTSCTTAAVPALHASPTQQPAEGSASLGRTPHLYLSPILAIDSPPPRAAAAA
jgi:hypothetical protein